MGTPDLDTILNKTFVFAKRTARKWYFEWAKNPPKSSAFNGEIIHVTREGWEHIIDDTTRSRSDVFGRLFVLERARSLLETATSFQDYRERTDLKHKHEYWVLDAVVADVRIRVIVRSIGSGSKHFLSVIKKGTIEKEIDDSKYRN